MAERLYYTDSYLTEFEATVVETGESNGRPYVVLDRSAFYPTSGGQPHDTGTLGDLSAMSIAIHATEAPAPMYPTSETHP